MRFSLFSAAALLSGSALAATGKLGDAPVTTNNVAGVTYQATLPDRNTTGLRGQITAISGANKTGVTFTINFYGFPPASQGPFIYHVHDQPVPADGNCTKTLAHLDPFVRGEDPVCDPSQPQTCQVGDLSGKFGNITSNPYTASYTDRYLTTTSGPGAFFGNRSIVIHNQNKTRLTCANFVLVSNATTAPNTTSPAVPSPTPSAYTGAATQLVASASLMGAVLVALMGVAF